MPISDQHATTAGHRLVGVYAFLRGLERDHIDPRLIYGKDPEHVRMVKLYGPRARPARLARLERGDPTLVPRFWLGGNYFPEARRWDNYLDRINVRGWEIRADDFVVAVSHDDPRWDEPGNRL